MPAILAAICGFGCRVAPEPTFNSASLQLPSAKLRRDSILLDIGFVSVPSDDQSQALWSQLDEQNLAPDIRRRLANNGLRAGLVSGRFPQELRDRIDQRHSSELTASESKASTIDRAIDGGGSNQRLQLRRGKKGQIVTGDTTEKLVLLSNQAGHVRGETFEGAQTIFVVEGRSNDDGSATIRLVPEVQHGQPQSRFVGRDGAFCLEASRARRVFEDLLIDARLSPGQTLVIGSSGPERSLGGSFLRHPGEQNNKKLLLIRLARSPGDTLFTATSEPAPVVDVAAAQSP